MYGGSLGQISNGATWVGGIELRDPATGDLWDLTGATIAMKVAPQSSRYSSVLTGSTSDGKVTNPTLGWIDWRFESSEMTCLSGTYAASILIQQNGDDVQLFLGTVAVLETIQ